MIISREDVDRCFDEAKHQRDYLENLYRLVFPEWDSIESIDGWPTSGKELAAYCCKKAVRFDAEHHKCLAGGLWMNNGFSVYGNDSLELWEVDRSKCKVTFKQEEV